MGDPNYEAGSIFQEMLQTASTPANQRMVNRRPITRQQVAAEAKRVGDIRAGVHKQEPPQVRILGSKGTPQPIFITTAGVALAARAGRRILMIQNISPDSAAMLKVGFNVDVSAQYGAPAFILAADPNGPATQGGQTLMFTEPNWVPDCQIYLAANTGHQVFAVVMEA